MQKPVPLNPHPRAAAGGTAAALLVLLLCAAAVPAVVARAETIRSGSVQVGITGDLRPKKLPRRGTAPVTVSFAGKIGSTDPQGPPQLLSIAIDINRHGALTHRGIPNCRIGRIFPSTTHEALSVCGRSVIGSGSFSADVKIPEQSPYPSQGRILAFNGRYKGRPAVLAHIYGKEPAPTSVVLPFVILPAEGLYGITLEASLPQATGDWGFVTGISLTLDRRFRLHGRPQSYLAASCPAPAGFPGAVFPLARTSFSFEGGKTVTKVLTRSCKVRQ